MRKLLTLLLGSLLLISTSYALTPSETKQVDKLATKIERRILLKGFGYRDKLLPKLKELPKVIKNASLRSVLEALISRIEAGPEGNWKRASQSGFSFAYPTTWIPINSEEMNSVYLVVKQLFDDRSGIAFVSANRITGVFDDEKSVMQEAERYISTNYLQPKLRPTIWLETSNGKVAIIQMSFVMEGQAMQGIQYHFIQDDQLVIFAYAGDSKNFNTHLSDFRKMMQTFLIK